MVFVKKEKFGQLIRLTNERWQHIVDRHPEVKEHLLKIQSTIQNPDIIVKNQYNQSERYYHKYFKSIKNHLIVVVEYEKSFIVTAFISRKSKKRRSIMEKALNFAYDKEGDILDVSLGRPEQAISEEIAEDLFVRLDPKTKKIIGFMLLNFEKRFNRTHKIEMLPIIGDFKLAKV